jgi:hypothetical protein
MTRKRMFWLTFLPAAFALCAGVSAVAGHKPVPIGPPDCRFVLCAYPDCGPDEQVVIPPGECCPVCVPA